VCALEGEWGVLCAIERDWGFVCKAGVWGELNKQYESVGVVCALQGEWGFVSATARDWGICVCNKNRVEKN
jgi:hypothetical protein